MFIILLGKQSTGRYGKIKQAFKHAYMFCLLIYFHSSLTVTQLGLSDPIVWKWVFKYDDF